MSLNGTISMSDLYKSTDNEKQEANLPAQINGQQQKN